MLDLTLLRGDCPLILGIDGLLLLHMVTHRVAAYAANARAYEGARYWMMDRGPDDRARACSDQHTDPSPFLCVSKLCRGDSGKNRHRAQKSSCRYPTRPHRTNALAKRFAQTVFSLDLQSFDSFFSASITIYGATFKT
jgi:hypothetical protein